MYRDIYKRVLNSVLKRRDRGELRFGQSLRDVGNPSVIWQSPEGHAQEIAAAIFEEEAISKQRVYCLQRRKGAQKRNRPRVAKAAERRLAICKVLADIEEAGDPNGLLADNNQSRQRLIQDLEKRLPQIVRGVSIRTLQNDLREIDAMPGETEAR